MTSENKLRKVSKKLHWGRGGTWLKHAGHGFKGIKRLDFFNGSQRQELKNDTRKEVENEC